MHRCWVYEGQNIDQFTLAKAYRRVSYKEFMASLKESQQIQNQHSHAKSIYLPLSKTTLSLLMYRYMCWRSFKHCQKFLYFLHLKEFLYYSCGDLGLIPFLFCCFTPSWLRGYPSAKYLGSPQYRSWMRWLYTFCLFPSALQEEMHLKLLTDGGFVTFGYVALLQ